MEWNGKINNLLFKEFLSTLLGYYFNGTRGIVWGSKALYKQLELLTVVVSLHSRFNQNGLK